MGSSISTLKDQEVLDLERCLRSSRLDERFDALGKVLGLASQWESKLVLGSERLGLIELLLEIVRETECEPIYVADSSATPVLEYFEVEIKSASGLAKADGMFGLSDPYVVVKWNDAQSEVGRTPVISKTLNPVWTDHNKFIISYPIDKIPSQLVLICEIWDHDFIGKHDFLGGFEVSARFLKDWLQEATSLASIYSSEPVQSPRNGSISVVGSYGGSALRTIELAKVSHISIEDQQLVQGSVSIAIRPHYDLDPCSPSRLVVVSKALDLLNSLSQRADNASRLGALGAIDLLVSFCQKYSNDSEFVKCKIKALELLKHLSMNDDNDSMMQSNDLGLLNMLTLIIRENSCGYYGRVHALGIIRNISLGSDFKKAMASDQCGLLELLVEISQESPTKDSCFDNFDFEVYSCKDLARADFEPFGLSDPYVVVKWNGKEIGRTPHITRNLNPVWKEQRFSFSCPAGDDFSTLSHLELLLEVWDYDLLGGGDFLGGLILKGESLSKLLRNTVDATGFVSNSKKLQKVDYFDMKEQGLVQGSIQFGLRHIFNEDQFYNSAKGGKEDKLDARINALYALWNLSGDNHQTLMNSSPIHSPTKGVHSFAMPNTSPVKLIRQLNDDLVTKLGSERLGLVELCLKIIKTDKTEARHVALNILKFLSRNKQNSHRMASEQLGLIEQFIKILRKEKLYDTRLVSLSILLNLSSRTSNHARMSSETLALQVDLLKIMEEEPHNSELFKMSLSIIKNLSYDASNQIKIGSLIGVSTVTKYNIFGLCMTIMKEESSALSSNGTVNVSVLLDSLKLINNLVLNKANETRLNQPTLGLVELLISISKNSADEIRVRSLGILWNFASNKVNQVRLASTELGLIELLMKIVRQERFGARIKALGILRHLSNNQANLTRMGSETLGLVELLMAAIKESFNVYDLDDNMSLASLASTLLDSGISKMSDFQESATIFCLSILQNLSSININKVRMGALNLGLIEMVVLIFRMGHRSSDCVLKSLNILWNLSLNIDNKVRMSDENLGLLSSLVQIYEDSRFVSNSIIDDTSMSLLWNISSDSNGLLMQMHRTTFDSELDFIESNKSNNINFLELLITLAGGSVSAGEETSPDHRQTALRVLARLSQFGRAELKEDMGGRTLGLLATLSQVLCSSCSDGDKDSRNSSLDIIHNLSGVGNNNLNIVSPETGLMTSMVFVFSSCNMAHRIKILNIFQILLSCTDVINSFSIIQEYCITIVESLAKMVDMSTDNLEIKRKVIQILYTLTLNTTIQSHIISSSRLFDTFIAFVIKFNPAKRPGWQWAVARKKILKAFDHVKLLPNLADSDKVAYGGIRKVGDLAETLRSLLELGGLNAVEEAAKKAISNDVERTKMGNIGSNATRSIAVVHNSCAPDISPREAGYIYIHEVCILCLYQLLINENGGSNVIENDKFRARNENIGSEAAGMLEFLVARTMGYYSSSCSILGLDVDTNDAIDINKLAKKLIEPLNIIRYLTCNVNNQERLLRFPRILDLLTSILNRCIAPQSIETVPLEEDETKQQSGFLSIDILTLRSILLSIFVNLSSLENAKKPMASHHLGLLEILLEIIGENNDPITGLNSENKLQCLSIMLFLSESYENRLRMKLANLGLISTLHLIIIEPKSLARDKASDILNNLHEDESSVVEDNDESYVDPDLVNSLVESLRQPKNNMAAKMKSLNALFDLSQFHETKSTLMSEQLMFLELLLEISKQDDAYLFKSLSILKNISSNGNAATIVAINDGKNRLGSQAMGWVSLIMSNMKAKPEIYLSVCLQILLNICTNNDLDRSMGFVNKNLNYLASDGVGLVRYSMGTIIANNSSSESIMCLTILNSLATVEANQVILGNQALGLLELLVSLVKLDNDQIILKSLSILMLLSQSVSNQVYMGSKVVGLIELILPIAQRGSFEYRSYALAIISRLASNSRNGMRLNDDSFMVIEMFLRLARENHGEIRVKSLEILQSMMLMKETRNRIDAAGDRIIDLLIDTLYFVVKEDKNQPIVIMKGIFIFHQLCSNALYKLKFGQCSQGLIELLLVLVQEQSGSGPDNSRKQALALIKLLVQPDEVKLRVVGEKKLRFVEKLLVVAREPQSPETRLTILDIFHELSAHDDLKLRLALKALGLVDFILEMLEAIDVCGYDSFIKALNILWDLSTNSENKVSMGDENISPVVSALRSVIVAALADKKGETFSEECHSVSLGTLQNLSTDEENKVSMGDPSAGIIEIAIASAKERRGDVRVKALGLLQNLSSSAMNKIRLGSHTLAVPEMLKSILDEGLRDKRSCYKALGTLHNLSLNKVNEVRLAQSSLGLVELLTALARSDKGDFRVKSLGILWNLAANSENQVHMASSELGLVDVLMSVVREDKSEAHAKALGVLRNLSIHVDNKEPMGRVETGLVELLISEIEEESSDNREDSLLVLQNLSTGDKNRSRLLKELEYSKIVPIIIHTLQTDDLAGTDILCMNILWNISDIDENKIELGTKAAGVFEALLPFITDIKDLELANRALMVLNNLILMNSSDAIISPSLGVNIERMGSGEFELISHLFSLLPASRGISWDDPRYIGQRFININVTKAICCLSISNNIQLQIASLKRLEVLAAIIKTDYSDSRFFVLSTLQNVSQQKCGQELMGLQELGLIDILINITKEQSIHSVSLSLGILGNISLNSDNAFYMACSAANLVNQLHLIIAESKTVELRSRALAVLVNLTSTDENQQFIGHEDSPLVHLLIDIIKMANDTPEETVLKSLCILKNLSVDPLKKARLGSKDVAVIELLVVIAHDDSNSRIRETCFEFFQNIFALTDNHQRFLALGLTFLGLNSHLEKSYRALTSLSVLEQQTQMSFHFQNGAGQIRKYITILHRLLQDFYNSIPFLPGPTILATASVIESSAETIEVCEVDDKTIERHNLSKIDEIDLFNNIEQEKTIVTNSSEKLNDNTLNALENSEVLTPQPLSFDPNPNGTDFLVLLVDIIRRDNGTTTGKYRIRALQTILALSDVTEHKMRLADESFGFIDLIITDILKRDWSRVTDSAFLAMQILWNLSGNKDGSAILQKPMILNLIYMCKVLTNLLIKLYDAYASNSQWVGDLSDTSETGKKFAGKLSYLDGHSGYQDNPAHKSKMRTLSLKILWFLSRNEANELYMGSPESDLITFLMGVITNAMVSEDSTICLMILHNLATAENNQVRMGDISLGLIGLLIDIIKLDSEEARIKALGVLSVLSHNNTNQERMGSESVELIELLASVIEDDRSLSRIACLNILWNLSRHDHNSSRLLLKQDSVSASAGTNRFENMENEDDFSVAFDEGIISAEVCESKGFVDYIALLTNLLREFDGKVHFNVLVMLLSLSNEENLIRLGSKDLYLVELLMRMVKLNKKSENCVLSLKLLYNIATNESNQIRMTEESLALMELLLEVTISDMSGYKIGVIKNDNPEISVLSLKIIQLLASNPMNQLKLTLEGLGLLKLYKKVAREDRSEACIIALQTLNTLARNCTINKIRMSSSGLGLVESLVIALKDNHSEVKHYSLILLSNLSESDNSMAHMLLMPEVQILQVLITVLYEASNESRSIGLRLLLNLVQLMVPPHPKPVLALPLFYDMVDMLIKLVRASDANSISLLSIEILCVITKFPKIYKLAMGDAPTALIECLVWALKADKPQCINIRIASLHVLKALSLIEENKVRMLNLADIDPPPPTIVSAEKQLSDKFLVPKSKSTLPEHISTPKTELLLTLSVIIKQNVGSKLTNQALSILQNLSVNQSNKVTMGSHDIGIPELLVSILKGRSQDNEASSKALGTLHNLSLNKVNEVRLAQSSLGLVELLTALARSDKGDFRVKSLGILWNLAANSENQVHMASSELGLVDVLMSVVREGKSEAHAKALGVLRNLSIHVDNKELMGRVETGLVELLISEIQEDLSEMNIREDQAMAFTILQNLSLNSTTKSQMGSEKLGLIEILVKILGSRGYILATEYQIRSLNLLHSLSLQPDIAASLSSDSCGLLPLLRLILSHSDPGYHYYSLVAALFQMLVDSSESGRGNSGRNND